MMRLVFPIVLIAAAIGIYFYLTEPLINDPLTVDGGTQFTMGGIKALREEKKQLETAIDYIAKLKGKALEIEKLASAISPEDIERLDQFLPDSVDDLQLLVDVDNIAKRSGMTIKDVKLSTDDPKKTRAVNNSAVVATQGATVAPPVITKVHLTFTAIGSYAQLRGFLTDVSKSLRIMDVEKLSVNVGGKIGSNASSTAALNNGIYQYQVDLATYWLK